MTGNVWVFLVSVLFVTCIMVDGRPHINNKHHWRRFRRSAMSDTADHPDSGERLSKNLQPTSYTLEIIPDIYQSAVENFTLAGRVTIQRRCRQNTDKIVLHAKDVEIRDEWVNLTRQSRGVQTTIPITAVMYNLTTEFLTIIPSTRLYRGMRYSLEISYTGPLTDDLHGLYISEYEVGEETHYTAISQLEPTAARKMFPCFDEPGFKATFMLTILRKAPMESLSNTRITDTVPRPDVGEGWLADTYERTPLMSTYLVAMAVHDFQYKSLYSLSGTLIRVWAPTQHLDKIDYALQIAKKSVDFFEAYTGVPYPLPKMDHISVSSFAWGGMENFGLLVYSDDYMFYDPDIHGLKTKRDVSLIINHEVAHQWFGNMVTCDWWETLWLNEAFTSYMEAFAMSEITPDLQVLELRHMHRDAVMQMDSLPSAHPVQPKINTRADIMHAFATTTYHKGAEIVAMLRQLMGEYAFRTAISRYLNEFKWRTATPEDLYYSFTQTLHDVGDAEGKYDLDIEGFMRSWVEQNNFPVVTIGRGQDGKIHLSQQRYVNPAPEGSSNGAEYGSSPIHRYRWKIPLFLGTNSSSKFRNVPSMWLTTSNATLARLPHIRLRENDWLLGNVGVNGYYRVNYDEKNWLLLSDQLLRNHRIIPTRNRAQLIRDIMELCKIGMLHPLTAIRLGRYLKHERRSLPWKVFIKEIETARHILSHSPYYSVFKNYMLEILTPVYRSYKWNPVKKLTVGMELMKMTLIKAACDFELDECIQKAVALFKNRENEPIEPDFRQLVYCTAIRAGGEQVWTEALEDLKTNPDYEAQEEIAKALTCTRDTLLLEKFLNFTEATILDLPSPIDFTILHSAMEELSKNPVGGSMGVKMALKQWDLVQDYYMMEEICKRLFTEEDAIMFREFRKSVEDDLHDDELIVCTEAIEANYKWASSNAHTIFEWLSNVYG